MPVVERARAFTADGTAVPATALIKHTAAMRAVGLWLAFGASTMSGAAASSSTVLGMVA